MREDGIVTSLSFLRQHCKETTWAEVEKLQLVRRLSTAIKYAWTPGVGLAANQIGINLRFAIYFPNMFNRTHLPQLAFLLNPKIISLTGLMRKQGEGCLSIPNRIFETARFDRVTFTSLQKSGAEAVFDVEGFEAQLIQHEIDHMDGKVCIDRLASAPTEPCFCGSGKKTKKCCL